MNSDRNTRAARDIQGDNNAVSLEINPRELITLFSRKRTLLIGSVLVAMVLVAIVMLMTPNRYAAHASILPSGKGSDISGLMGLAGSFGFGSGGSVMDENSSTLYPSIMQSDLIRDGVLAREYSFGTDDQQTSTTLEDYFEVPDPNELRGALSRITSISTDKKLGIVRLRVETTSPVLSQAILFEYLTQLEDYLNNKRRSRASENEAYLNSSVATRSKELETAENELQKFMEANRNWATSSDPELNMAVLRLKRVVTVASETSMLLAQQLELARLETQKDIPIVRILDQPSLPTTKSGPTRTVNVIFAGMTAFVLIALWILAANLWQQLVTQTKNSEIVIDNETFPSTNRPGRKLELKSPAEEQTTV